MPVESVTLIATANGTRGVLNPFDRMDCEQTNMNGMTNFTD